MNLKRLVRLVLPVILGLIIVGYSIWQLRQVIGGPEITVDLKPFSQPVTEPLVTVAGTAKNIDWLYLNGQQIFTNENGQFSAARLALPGYNMLQLVGKDKFNRFITRQIEFIYDQKTENQNS